MASLDTDTTVSPQPVRTRRRRWAWITIATVGLLSASAFLAVPAIAQDGGAPSHGSPDDRVVVCESGVEPTATSRSPRPPRPGVAEGDTTPAPEGCRGGLIPAADGARLRPRLGQAGADVVPVRARKPSANHGRGPRASGRFACGSLSVAIATQSDPTGGHRSMTVVALGDAVAVGDEGERRSAAAVAESTFDAWSPRARGDVAVGPSTRTPHAVEVDLAVGATAERVRGTRASTSGRRTSA